MNAEGTPCPRAQQGRPNGWASSSVRWVLFRPLYRGEVVWNQTRKRDAWGRHKVQDRAEHEWLRLDAPELRIVSDEQWKAAHARLDAARQTYLAGTQVMLWGRPPAGTVSQYLLTGLMRCGKCGGGFIVRQRKHGHKGGRQFLYACSTLHLRGRSICGNNLQIPMSVADDVIADMLAEEVLRPDLIEQAIGDVWRAFSRPDDTTARRAKAEVEIAKTDREIGNLTNALALGGDMESVVMALRARQTRRRELCEQVDALKAAPRRTLTRDVLAAEVRKRLANLRA